MIKSKIMTMNDIKNIFLFTQYLSKMMPTMVDVTKFKIDIAIIVVPNVFTEYPNCLAIVGKNPMYGPIPNLGEKKHLKTNGISRSN